MVWKATESDLELGRKATMGGWTMPGSEVPMILESGKGAVVWDIDGNEYIDCTSQAWVLNLGFQHPRVIEAARQQLETLYHIRGTFQSVPQLLLTKKLAEIAPGDFDKCIQYCLHGSLATEGAMKIALRNRPGAANFISLFDGYHGRSIGSMAVTWPHPDSPFLAFMGNVVRVPQAYCYRCYFGLSYPSCGLQCVDYIRQAILKGTDGPPAAFIMEPIQGNGGMIDFPREYYPAIQKLCNELGLLLIWDEVQTAFGRLGAMFAADLYGVVPDIVTFGKAVGGGMPLAGTIQRADIEPLHVGDHAFTAGVFPPSMAAALATIEVLEENDRALLKRCQEMGHQITSRLLELKDQYELIGDVRGPGLMIGIELVRSRKTKEPALEETEQFVVEGLKRGVIFGESRYGGLGNVIKIKPPLVISDAEVERVLEVTAEALEALSSQ